MTVLTAACQTALPSLTEEIETEINKGTSFRIFGACLVEQLGFAM